LGLWIENTEGAKFWMKVFNNPKTRGVADILIAVTDGVKGIPDALGTVFLATTMQICILNLIRNSLDHASWKERKPVYTASMPMQRPLPWMSLSRVLRARSAPRCWGRGGGPGTER